MRRDDYAKAIEDQGFKLVYNPPGDGNCQFAALSHQTKRLGILRSPETMRKEIVEYLKSSLYKSDGFPLLEHLADDEFACWDDYITHMARDGTYWDQITPYAAANLSNIDIQIISSLGVGGHHVFTPLASVSAATHTAWTFCWEPRRTVRELGTSCGWQRRQWKRIPCKWPRRRRNFRGLSK